jgi:hypothetical protein
MAKVNGVNKILYYSPLLNIGKDNSTNESLTKALNYTGIVGVTSEPRIDALIDSSTLVLNYKPTPEDEEAVWYIVKED